MNFKTGYAFNTKELFEMFDISNIKTHHSILKEFYKTREKKEMAVQVFLYAVKLIILDIINNSVTFVLPTARRSQIQMKSIKGNDFKKYRLGGGFQKIDFLETNFTGYQLEFKYWTKESERSKKIYVGNNFKNEIIENTNKGKKYY